MDFFFPKRARKLPKAEVEVQYIPTCVFVVFFNVLGYFGEGQAYCG